MYATWMEVVPRSRGLDSPFTLVSRDDLNEVIDPTWAVMTRETGPSSMQSEMACSLPNADPFIHIGPSAPVPAPRRAAEALLPARWKHDTRHALQDDGLAVGYKLRCAA